MVPARAPAQQKYRRDNIISTSLKPKVATAGAVLLPFHHHSAAAPFKAGAAAGRSHPPTPLWHHGEEQERREYDQVDDALEHRGPAGAERDHADEQRQCQQEPLLVAQPKLQGLAKDE